MPAKRETHLIRDPSILQLCREREMYHRALQDSPDGVHEPEIKIATGLQSRLARSAGIDQNTDALLLDTSI